MYISTESKNILINMDECYYENLNFKSDYDFSINKVQCMLKYNLELVYNDLLTIIMVYKSLSFFFSRDFGSYYNYRVYTIKGVEFIYLS